jgi:hypothetical protein
MSNTVILHNNMFFSDFILMCYYINIMIKGIKNEKQNFFS